MRFRTGVMVGLVVGYYYGAKAGRERYLQLEAYLDQVRTSEAYRGLIERVSALADAGLEQTSQLVRSVADGRPSETPGPFDYVGDPTLN